MSERHRHRHRHCPGLRRLSVFQFQFAGLRRSAVAILGLTVWVAALPGCGDDPARSACLVESRQVALADQPGPAVTPLMLLPGARLDVVGGGFVLLGTDGTYVRWAQLTGEGIVMGQEHAIPVPEHSGGPWFGVAGLNAPGDHLVVAYLPVDAPEYGTTDLMTFSVRIDNTDPTLPVPSGPVPVAARAKVSMMSGRAGMHAGVAWGAPGQSTLWARLLGGDGLPIASDLNLGTVQDSGCLRFSPGHGDLTVGYVDLTGSPPDPVFVATEISETGVPTVPVRLRLGKPRPGCVELAPSAQGYALAWHSAGLGTSFGTYEPARAGFPSRLVLSDVRVDGPLPRLGGVSWLGRDFALVFAWRQGAQVWPLDAGGQSRGTVPLLPSAAANTGTVSVQGVGTTMYVTYADYPSLQDRTTGSRLFARVTCP